MIQYNVTVIIEPDAQREWVNWMRNIHIPEVMATGCFLEYKMTRLIEPCDGNITYCMQYICRDMETYHYYKKNFAPGLQQKHAKRFEGKFTAFRTLLEIE